MDYAVVFMCFCGLIIFAEGQSSDSTTTCYDFKGDSYLHFTPNNFNNDDAIHYSLTFRTTQENGILMYAKGLLGDDEALFIKNGKLKYHLFNTSPSGVEGYFGAYLEGNETVNTNEWITVHVYRLWGPSDRKTRRIRKKTGFEVNINGTEYSHVDYLERSDISIQPVIYFGGYKESLSSTLQNFLGQIKGIYEEKNKQKFENPSLNYRSKVGLTCA